MIFSMVNFVSFLHCTRDSYLLPVCMSLVFSFTSSLHGQEFQADQKTSSKPPQSSKHSLADVQIHRIVFGSCIKQDQPMLIFRRMLDVKPDLALLIGDNIYGDTDDMKVLRGKYETLRRNPDYSRFANAVPILATWDDHDFGRNDAGSDYPYRHESQIEFLRFWKVPEQSERWQREGVYHSQIFGSDDRRVQIILLDTRFFRSALKKGVARRLAGPYVPDADPEKTLLGEAQWQWLHDRLQEQADLRFIVTSIQLIAESAGQETWSNLPIERERFLKLLRSTNAQGVVLLSGDRHWSELSCLDDVLEYPLYELTSSSLNQKHSRGTPSENQFRVGSTTFHERNFGVIEIDWESRHPIVSLDIRDSRGEVRLQQSINFNH